MSDDFKLKPSPHLDLLSGAVSRDNSPPPVKPDTGVPYGWVYALKFDNLTYYIGKVARGKSGRNPAMRFHQHRRAAEAGGQSAVYKAWRELGEPQLEILEEYFPRDGASDDEADAGLSDLAAKWIANTAACNRKFGYNTRQPCRYGGQLPFKE